MQVEFKTILIPVDFSINTGIAVEKALELSSGHGTCLHLLHVPQIGMTTIASFHHYFAPYTFNDELPLEDAKTKLEVWQQYITAQHPHVHCIASMATGDSIQNLIIDRAKAVNADLVVVGKKSSHTFLPFLNTVVPNKIAKATGIPVLTVKPGSHDRAIKLVVVPIGKYFPKKKLDIIEALHKQFNIQVKLVSFRENNDRPTSLPMGLANAFVKLKQLLQYDVSYELISGRYSAKEILRYCKNVNADLVVVHPGTETKMGCGLANNFPMNCRLIHPRRYWQ